MIVSSKPGALRDRNGLSFNAIRIGLTGAFWRQETGSKHMLLDDVADRRQQARNVTPLHPAATFRIEDRL